MAISELYCCYILMVVSGFARAMSTTMNKNKNGPSAAIVLHWFRHGDLRLHDNPALVFSSKAEYVLPIFCFDNSVYGSSCATPSGSLKCGPRRAKFVLESVEDLRQNIQDRWGGELLVTHGKPADVFDQVLCEFKGRAVDIVVQDEVLKEERDVVNSVRSVLKKHCKNGILHAVWGSTMYDIDDLPFEKDLQDMPDVFTPFKNKVEKSCHIRRPLPTPNKLAVPSKEIQKLVGLLGKSPTLESLGYSEEDIKESETPDARGVMAFVGGEAAALKRVNEYIWEKDLLKDYFETRNGMIGADYSTKLSPWLAHGCVSPRFVAAECKKYEEQRVANKSTYWVVFELLWRDFCKFFALKNGDAVFFAGGTIGSNKKWPHFAKNFQAWKEGRTGYPLVDANMRELKATGFMSNRGRQNVASFLALDCNNDWRAGGDWFETHLLDYDVYSNWVNWCAAAGMSGGRVNRFNIVKQSKDYDQHGDYVRLWLPELKSLPNEFIHEPWKMNQFQQAEYNVRLGVDYPSPIIPPFRPNGGGSRESGNRGGNRGGRQRKENSSGRNRHQKHNMNSLKQGQINIR